MEPRRALEILRRQSGCHGAGCQRAAAGLQPARPAGDPVGIGQFDDLDVVAIRVEHGAGPPACRYPASASQVTPKQPRCRAVARASSTCALMITRAGSGFRAGHVVTAVDQQADPAELYEVNQRFTPQSRGQ